MINSYVNNMHSKDRPVTSKSVHDIAARCAKLALQNWQHNYQKKHGKEDKNKTQNHFDIFFPNERRVHSIMQSGLTSFGMGFWEPLAQKLAERNGFENLDKKNFNQDVPKIPNSLKDYQQKIRVKVEEKSISLKEAVKEIKKFILRKKITSNERTKVESGKGIDFWFKKNNIELIGDIKSPQENIGNSKKLAEHILIWSTYRLLDNPEAKVDAVIAFPYNPYQSLDEYMKEQGNKFSLLEHGTDILLADDFWDRLSGVKNSTSVIFKALKSLSSSKEVLKIRTFFNAK